MFVHKVVHHPLAWLEAVLLPHPVLVEAAIPTLLPGSLAALLGQPVLWHIRCTTIHHLQRGAGGGGDGGEGGGGGHGGGCENQNPCHKHNHSTLRINQLKTNSVNCTDGEDLLGLHRGQTHNIGETNTAYKGLWINYVILFWDLLDPPPPVIV